RLLKNKMVVHVSDCGLHATCKCGKVIKFKRSYDESYFESHINNNGCNFPNGDISILNFFPTIPKENNQPVMKRFGLNNSVHKAYISHVITHTTHGGVELLDEELIRQSKWKIEGLAIRSVLCEQYTTCSSHLYDHCKELQNDQIFKDDKGLQNLKYSDQFSDFLVILASLSPRAYNIFRQNFAGRAIQNISPDLCFENVVQVKRLVDTLNYTSLIIAISNNTKLKERLGFSSLYSCIVGSTLSIEKTKSYNAIASQVRVYLLQIKDDFADEDADIGVINKKLNLSILINQRRKHEAYTNQRMERKIAEFSSSGLNNRFNTSLVSFLLLDEHAHPGLADISTVKCIRLFKKDLELVLALYYKNTNYYSFIESHSNVDELFYISAKVFFQLHYGLFSSVSDGGYLIFTHMLPSSVIYYFEKGNFVSFDEKLGLLTVNNSTLELFNYFNTSEMKRKLQEIL
ncbi:4603_t:CDS:2, partial [Gigaspora margarita]